MGIVKFPTPNEAQDPNIVLEAAKDQFESLVIIGWDKHERLDARATLNLTAAEIYWMISVFAQKLISGDYADD